MKDFQNEPSRSPQQRKRVLKTMLILVGLGAAVSYGLQLVWVPLWIPGLALISWGAARQTTRWIITGGIITGTGLAIALQSNLWVMALSDQARTGIFLGCFAVGWFLIPLVTWLATPATVWWPLLPGTVMAITGAAFWLLNGRVARLPGLIWPVLFICIGLFLLVRWNR